MDNPLRVLTKAWIGKIHAAMEYKKKHFQNAADEAMRFFNGPYTFLYDLQYKSGSFAYAGDPSKPKPRFCMTVNKVAEMVQLFGPVLYHKNPVRKVNPRKVPMVGMDYFGDPNDPNVQQVYMQLQQQIGQARSQDRARADLLQHYLNFTPEALDLKTHSRQAIDEAIIKGLGVLWSEPFTPVSGQFQMVGSFYDTVDNLLIDPDMDSSRNATWKMRRCCHPVWKVEQEYGKAPGSLKGLMESRQQQEMVSSMDHGDYRRKQGLTNDLLVYWKIYSKMGMGNKLQGVVKDKEELAQFDQLGDFAYLVVADGHPEPLNLPKEMWEAQDWEAMAQATAWPTPYWMDDKWPVTEFSFHQVPGEVYPMSHLSPGMGELQFINWAYSFIAGKIQHASRDLIAVMKGAGEEIKRALVSGTDYELLEIERAHGGTINDVVQFLQHPPFQGDIWKVIVAVENNFEKRVGLSELMYGQSAKQIRSATEADVKSDQLHVRPDDMATKVEEAMTETARKEALCARWHLDPRDVMPVLGPLGAQMWEKLLWTVEPTQLIHQLEYRIEAGSIRKPNRDKQMADANTAMQTLFQPLWQYAMQSGQVSQVNALIGMWAKANDLEVDQLLLQPPPPPQGPSPEEQELMHDEQSHRQEMRQDTEKHKLDMKIKKEQSAAKAKAVAKTSANGAK